MTTMRLHKFMASCGVGSRRACEELIVQGRVEVDGRVVTTLGTQVDPDTQVVRCDGRTLHHEPELHYLLNKPRGAICSSSSSPGMPRALDFLPQRARDRRLFTIGRLDVDSEGAIVLTNDGELCHLVSHPRFGVPKTYRVEVEGEVKDETLDSMRKGVWLAEGRTGEVDASLLHRSREKSQLLVTLHEGKRREVRRLCARFGHEVRHLVRVAIGPIELGALRPGEVRVLVPAEVEALRKAARAVIRLGGGRGGAAGKASAAAGGGGRRNIPGREYHAFRKEAAKGGRAGFAKLRRKRDERVAGRPNETPSGRARRNRHAGERTGPPTRGGPGGRRGPPTGRGPGRKRGRPAR
jgi:23S rRNA pseudouridine2605 synthase